MKVEQAKKLADEALDQRIAAVEAGGIRGHLRSVLQYRPGRVRSSRLTPDELPDPLTRLQ